jgi:uncharacterized membrane protein YfcA
MMETGLFVLGLAAGVLSGLFGIGGGVVMVPMLIAVFGLDILNANATSLAAMLLPVGVLGVIAYYKAGLLDLKKSLWIAVGLVFGSYAGAELAVNLNESVLAKLYAAFLLYVAVSYVDIRSLFGKKKPEQVAVHTAGKAIWSFILLGVVAGIIAGMFGKGGGLIIVPALVKLFRYDPKAAAATSLAALQLPVGLPSVIVYAHDGHLNILYAALIAAGIVVGVLGGTKIAVRMPSAMFKKVYALFLFAVAIYMVFKYV